MELSIDTSTNITGIALSEEGEVISELNWITNYNHTVELAPNVLSLLKKEGRRVEDIKAIIVAIGPGSFSGLRVGMGFAKGISLVLNIPIVGIGTLHAQAYPFLSLPFRICSLMDMRRGEVAASIFRGGEKVEGEHLAKIEEICEKTVEKTVFCGEIKREDFEKIKKILGEKAIIPPPSLPRRAGYFSALGWERIKRGERDDVSSLEPLYLRKPSITERKR